MAHKYSEKTAKKNVGKIENRGKPGYNKDGTPKKKLGRPRDTNKDLPLEEQRKVYLEMHKKGEELTIGQIAVAMWDPKKEAKPLSKMAVLKILERAIKKMRAEFKRRNITGWNDIYSERHDSSPQFEYSSGSPQ